jgi:hypothetical protein
MICIQHSKTQNTYWVVTMVKKPLELDPSFTYFLNDSGLHMTLEKKKERMQGYQNYKYFPIVTWRL